MNEDIQKLVSKSLLSLVEEYSPDIVYIADIKSGKYLYISSTEELLGYPSERFCCDGGIEFCFSIMHPDDVKLSIDSYNKMLEKFSDPGFDKTRVGAFTTEYRLKHAKGNWIWLQSKDCIIKYDEEGRVQLTFGLATIITARKEKELSIVFSPELEELIKGLDNKIVTNKKNFNTLSKREKEIVRLLGEGMSTKMIAEKLSLSFYTVETHRKNILQKLNLKNTAELIKNFYKYAVE